VIAPPKIDPRWRYPAIRYLLGSLLVTSAGLKLFGMGVTPLPETGWFSSPRLHLAATQWEFVLAAWLFSGQAQPASWLAAAASFIAFAGTSAYMWWMGESSCGCLGPIRAHPWHLFSVDGTVMLMLVFARPNLRPFRVDARSVWQLIWPASVAGTLALLLFGSALAASSSIEAWVSWLRGDSIAVSTRMVDFGEVSPGEVRQASVDLRNRTDRPVSLLGGTQTPMWSVTSTLPLTVPPGETRELLVSLNVPEWKPGIVTNLVQCLTDDPTQRTIRFNVTCRVK
jgi:hypothetical protein